MDKKKAQNKFIEELDDFEKEDTLSELLSQCKPENRHETIDFGVEGKELI